MYNLFSNDRNKILNTKVSKNKTEVTHKTKEQKYTNIDSLLIV